MIHGELKNMDIKLNKRDKDSDSEEVEGEMKGFLEAIDLDDSNDQIEDEEPSEDNAVLFHALCCVEKLLEF